MVSNKNFNVRGQGTIEYLVIVAIVVVIGLIVGLLILGQSTNTVQPTNEKASQTGWASASPFSILAWQRTGTQISLVVQNNSAQSLDLDLITVDTGTSTGDQNPNMAPGAKKTVVVTGLTACTAGTGFEYAKGKISIRYDVGDLNGQIQLGSAPLTGKCQ